MSEETTIWNFRERHFDGIGTKIVRPENPLAGAAAFSIEVELCPEAGGPEEQRFLHIQGDDGSRALLELRATPDGWYGDVFVHFPSGERFLNDPALLHPFDEWTIMKLSYTGSELRQYVNGKLELTGEAPKGALGPGVTSVGMRLNDISPFRGRIAEVRMTRGLTT
ncbi:MAG: LamG-like jellyroll fold domain-containing protein [Oceanipulchritudo sp.]